MGDEAPVMTEAELEEKLREVALNSGLPEMDCAAVFDVLRFEFEALAGDEGLSDG